MLLGNGPNIENSDWGCGIRNACNRRDLKRLRKPVERDRFGILISPASNIAHRPGKVREETGMLPRIDLGRIHDCP